MEDIKTDENEFEKWLKQAQECATTLREQVYVQEIREGYRIYREDFGQLCEEVKRTGGIKQGYRQLAKDHPVREVIAPCEKYARINEEMMTAAAQEGERVTQRLHLTMLLVGLGGPLGGLIGGYGIGRGLQKSLYRFQVRVQDAAQQLEHNAATVSLSADADMDLIDQQLERVVKRVSEVTGQLQQQQQDMLRAQQLAAVGQLAAGVAHEVRNPLTAIKLLVEAALRTHKPRPFTPENLKVVHGEILRLEQIVQNFLDFARPPALHRQHCDVRDLVQRAVSLIRTRARQQQVDVRVQCPEQPILGTVDGNKLSTVLVNLLLNALDAMPSGGQLTVALEADGAELHCRVEDTGAGIRPEMLAHLFTPFSSTKETGSGLGLSICRRIIEEHGGQITGGNREGGGARFAFRLPADDSLVIATARGPYAANPGN